MSQVSTKQAEIICVFNDKGGSGKTHTSVLLAGTLGLRGYDVLVADLDPTGLATKWMQREQGKNIKGTVTHAAGYQEGIADKLVEWAPKHDVIICDCAPGLHAAGTWEALAASSLILIPSKPMAADMTALFAARAFVKEFWEKFGERIPARVAPLAIKGHMRDHAAAVESMRKDKDIPPLKATLGDRAAFHRSMMRGGTCHTMPDNKLAVAEIEAQADEVLGLLNLPKTKKGGV